MKKTVLTLLLGVTTFTGGVLVAMDWTGSADLKEAEAIATAFKSKAVEYVTKAKELEELANTQNVDIGLLLSKIDELKALKTELQNKVIELEEALANAEGDNTEAEAELQRLTAELTKANEQITKANEEVTAHKEAIKSMLDSSIFQELSIPERIDISGALEEEQNQNKYKYIVNVSNIMNTAIHQQAEGFAQSKVIPFIEKIDLTAEQIADVKEVSIRVTGETVESFKATVSIVMNSSTHVNAVDKVLNGARAEALTIGITNLTVR